MKKSIFMFGLVTICALAITSCSNNTEENAENETTETSMNQEEEEPYVLVGGAKMVPSLDIVSNALGSNDHTTLVAAVKAGDLVETLKSTGPFTVFAPTNDAFANLPDGTVETLLQPENKSLLQSVLTYHVVAGSIKAADLQNGQMLETVNGEKLKVSIKDGIVKINESVVTIPDVISSNGVTHVVDAVLLPKKM